MALAYRISTKRKRFYRHLVTGSVSSGFSGEYTRAALLLIVTQGLQPDDTIDFEIAD